MSQTTYQYPETIAGHAKLSDGSIVAVKYRESPKSVEACPNDAEACFGTRAAQLIAEYLYNDRLYNRRIIRSYSLKDDGRLHESEAQDRYVSESLAECQRITRELLSMGMPDDVDFRFGDKKKLARIIRNSGGEMRLLIWSP